jgi:HAE1 family hydrophobic/amphiphilic exporter-1
MRSQRLNFAPSVPYSGQLPSVTISFGLGPGFSLGQATDEIEETARAMLPGNITATFQGTAKVFQDSMCDTGILLVIAILAVYIGSVFCTRAISIR